ncbi:iron-sulfur cluster co-chaperone protein HscB, mitochondrial [Arachis ipaensis]|uniref:iron-sulfur cluster co-chaperone protein HscB, mitochondrial n=1 Tax=Arachis ipaensis TaxID=130454 RepID=UPI0007AEECBD|nr:iron-sulfur cluster co-chaperone protein HscB, mitochondrial [Arachis ipaensis]XP_025634766.1 iron-sulfur cluster co-chaperone protein HscB homolog [Arachis hypogaea]
MLKKNSTRCTLFTILRHTTPSVPKHHSPLTFSSHSNNHFLHTSSPPPPFSPKGRSFHNPTWFYSFGYLTFDGKRLCSKSAESVKARSSRCWNCHESTAAAPFLVCDSCRCIQPVDDSIDYFEIFGLEKKYDIEGVNLEGKYKDWQKKLHPDLVHSKSQKERDFSAEQSARVIDAYRTLSKPLSRAIYMMKLDGLEVDEEQTISDPELLAEIMEIREAVEEATESESLKKILSRMEENLKSWSNTFATAFQSRNFEEAKDSIRRMTYYSRVIDEVVKKL